MALRVLKAFNLSEAELKKAEAAWGPLVIQAEEAAKAAEPQRAHELNPPAAK